MTSPSHPRDHRGRSEAGPAVPLHGLGARVLSAKAGHILVVSGVGATTLRASLDSLIVPTDGPLVLLVSCPRMAPTDKVIEDLVAQIARVALELWPVWYDDVDFSGLDRDSLDGEAARQRLAEAARKRRRVSREWLRAAARLALVGKVPRPEKVHWSIECTQLCLAIHPSGLVLVMDLATPPEPEAAHPFVHALELVAGKAKVAIVLLCATLPDFVPPFDRILADAVSVTLSPGQEPPQLAEGSFDDSDVFLAPISGKPHPLSEVEKKVAKAIAAAPDLAALFRYNQCVETVRGSRPKVDLLWHEGRLVVELDGYRDHARRDIFASDRHRDYELTLSGYTVLRLANDEVLQDVEMAVDKIRDVVRFLSSGGKGSA